MCVTVCFPKKYRNKRNNTVIDVGDYAVLRFLHGLANVRFQEEDWEIIEKECEVIG